MNKKELLKQYLDRYNQAKIRIKELKATQKQIRMDAGCPSSPSDSTSPKVQSNSISRGAAEFAIRIVEIDERIERQKVQLSTLLSEILDVFDYLPLDSEERAVLELRYIQGKSQKFICEKARHMSRSKYFALCDATFKKLLKYQRINIILKKYSEELKRFEA